MKINYEYNNESYTSAKINSQKYIMLTLNVMKESIDQTWSIKRIVDITKPRTWESVFQDAIPELYDVSTVLEEQEKLYGEFYPMKKDIFAPFNYTALTNIKVVILGQDPYHQAININGTSMPRGIGFAFSVRREDSIPVSLQNIYTELANSVRGFVKPDHGDLREWAKQGVLLINTCLTVRPNQAGSHGDIWLGFINKVFKAIAIANPNCVYMLWGREAQKLKSILGANRDFIFEAAHPSGFSARHGFFGCNHFNLANEALIKQGKIAINWKISKIAELNNVQIPALSTVSKSNGESRQLIPVNAEMLSTIISSKPPTNTGMPIITGMSNSIQTNLLPFPVNNQQKSHENNGSGAQNYFNQQSIVPMLQILPINRPSSSITQQSKSPSPPTSEQHPTVIPSIPKIQFGMDTGRSIPTKPENISTLTGTPQFITNIPDTKHPLTLTGLPIIPQLVQ